MKKKRCTRCNILKDMNDFRKREDCKDERGNVCKNCRNKNKRERGAKAPEKRRAWDRKYWQKNKKKINERARTNYAADPKKRKAWNAEYYKNNKQKVNKQKSERKKKALANDPEYRTKTNKQNRESERRRVATYPGYREKINKLARENRAEKFRENLTTGLNILINEIQKGVSK